MNNHLHYVGIVRLSIFISFLFLLSISLGYSLESAAYVPYYRLDVKRGAENALGRPSYNPEPNAYDNRLLADGDISRGVPQNWKERNWGGKLTTFFDTLYLHIPLDKENEGQVTPDSRHLSYLKNLIHQKPVEIALSIIGIPSNFMPFAANPESRERWSKDVASLIRKYSLDGLDLNWEFPAAIKQNEREALTELVRSLRQNLPPETWLSIAVSRWRLPNKDLFKFVDRVNLMAYDGYGRHATYESAVADTELVLTRNEIPLEKMFIGLPYYGRVFVQSSKDYWQKALSYRDIVRDFSPEPQDDEAGTYYFNGPSTIARKTSWAKERGIGGIFVWEPFHDVDDNRSLSRVIWNTINGESVDFPISSETKENREN